MSPQQQSQEARRRRLALQGQGRGWDPGPSWLRAPALVCGWSSATPLGIPEPRCVHDPSSCECLCTFARGRGIVLPPGVTLPSERQHECAQGRGRALRGQVGSVRRPGDHLQGRPPVQS